MARLDGPGTIANNVAGSAGQNTASNFKPPTVGGVVGGIKDIGQDIFSGVGAGAANFASALRGANLPGGGNDELTAEKAVFANKKLEDKDWRVSLSMPVNPSAFKDSPLLKPLKSTGNRLVFPYTPTIVLQQNANYQSMAPVHNNYPFFTYENSNVNDILLIGQFYVQNSLEAQYWTAVLHYLRSITKMDYGRFATGQPPPIVKLNGYGDYVFNNVPVVVTTFTVDMARDVDYIATHLDTATGHRAEADIGDGALAWAPAESQFSINVQPIYSRDSGRHFNYREFIKGKTLGKGFI